jgi:putative endonuclease
MTRRGRTERRRAVRHGRLAEALCRFALRLKGYRIVAADLRGPHGQVDIVAVRGAVMAVIEVKARRGGEAAATIGRRQRDRIVRAAEALRARRPDLARLALRFDAMLIDGVRWPRHVPDAWRPDG